MARPEKHVFVCGQSRPDDHPKGSCQARGCKPLIDGFREQFEERELWGKFKFSTSSCLGACEQGPIVLVYPEGVMYQKVQADDVTTIIDEHLIGGTPVEALKISKEIWD